jgi:hypothetical protein
MGMTDEMNPDEAPLPTAHATAAAAYNAPSGEVPRDAMWAAIQARHSSASADGVHIELPNPTPRVTVTHTTRGALPTLSRWVTLATVSSVIALGAVVISTRIGSPSVTVDAPVVSAAKADSAASAVAWQQASTEHFGFAETMLATLSAPGPAESDAQLSAWSRDLLQSTRLLMDSPAGRDPKRRALLLDLELVLVQLVQSGPKMQLDDRTVMDELLSQSALLLTRIRTTVPAGMPASRN